MKRVLFAITMCMACMSAGAQKWEKIEEKADELKGTPARVRYRLWDESNPILHKGLTFYIGDDRWKAGIAGDGFMPDKRGLTHRNSHNLVGNATIGFYDEDMHLLKKWDNCLIELTNGFQVAEASETLWGKTAKGCRDVVPYLTDERGYVRIIIPTYRHGDFDLTVPCLRTAPPTP